MLKSTFNRKLPVLESGFGLGGPLSLTVPTELANTHFIPKFASFETKTDHYWMFEALRTSLQGIGLTSPNPSVGCVLVDREGLEISRGFTQPFPGIHAERNAFNQIQDRTRLKGATAYVTLEPCSHHGNQPPCVDLLLQSDVKRIIVARGDPNPKVNGEGLQKLRNAGKEVQVGIYGPECTAWNFGFFAHQVTCRPVVILKWAQTLDGQLVDDTQQSQWISGPAARAYTHWLRQRYDAILVGARTLLTDFPQLSVRDCALPHQANPLPIIFDPQGLLFRADTLAQQTLNQKTFTPGRNFAIATLQSHLDKNTSSWLAKKQEITWITLPGKNLVPEFMTALESKPIQMLLGHPLQTIFIEGGPKTITSFLKVGFADAVHAFIAPIITGGTQGRIELLKTLKNPHRLELVSSVQLGNDILLELVPENILESVFRCE